MNRLIALLILLGGAATGIGQGSVAFQNSVGFATIDPTGGAHLVYESGPSFDPSPTGNGLRGTQYVAELYYGTDAGSLAPVTASVSRFRGSTTMARGKWAVSTTSGAPNEPTVLVGSVPRQIVFLQVKAWDFTEAQTYEGATTRGASTVFTYKIATPGFTPPGYDYMEGLQAFFVTTPEPSMIALGILGMTGLFLIRRRK